MKRIVIIAVFVALASASKLAEKYSWKELSFAWPSEEARQAAIKSGQYVEAHNLPLGLEVWRDKLFITVPRWVDDGVLHQKKTTAIFDHCQGSIEWASK